MDVFIKICFNIMILSKKHPQYFAFYRISFILQIKMVSKFIQYKTIQSIMSDQDETWNLTIAMNKIRTALEDNDQSVTDFFSSLDGDGDGEINGPELFRGLQKVIGNRLSPSQVSMIIKALDINEDNRIDLSELKLGLESNEEE